MTLEKTLRQELSDPAPGGFHISSQGWSVTLVTEQRDSLSCLVKELVLEHAAPIQESLQRWGQRIAQNATGLLEPLRLMEAEPTLGKAILRADRPAVQHGKTYYYELLLDQSGCASATLRRYAGNRLNGEKRASISFALTHDAIVKLISDIVGGNTSP